VRLARLRRPKILYSPLYAEFRSRANASNVGLGSHAKGRALMGEMGISRIPKI
jgi:hypothetical protein